jgi:hypothetical protein
MTKSTTWGKLMTVSKLAIERRTDLLRELLAHRAFVVRELVTLLKLSAAMALLGTPSVRARSGYDHVTAAAEVESGLRVRLPLLASQPEPLRVWPGRDGATTEVELPSVHPSEAP